MAAKITAAEKERYLVLAEQQAHFGYATPPHIILELNELRQKYGPPELLDVPAPEPDRRRRLDLNLEWLLANVAIMFRRQTQLESGVQLGRWLDIMQIGLLVLVLLGVAAQWVDRFGWLW